MSRHTLGFAAVAASLLAACMSAPTGPSVLALPGSGKTIEQFQADDGGCRRYAIEQGGTTPPSAAANGSAVRSAVAGTAIGAVAGAAIGGQHGAGVGAGSGLVVGSLAGSDASSASWFELQRRYDFAYIQCMYAKGHRVPVPGEAGY